MLSRNGYKNEDGSFDWNDALADAAIVAGSTFFITLGAVALVVGADVVRSIAAAGIAAGSEFFAILVMKRNLPRKETPKTDGT